MRGGIRLVGLRGGRAWARIPFVAIEVNEYTDKERALNVTEELDPEAREFKRIVVETSFARACIAQVWCGKADIYILGSTLHAAVWGWEYYTRWRGEE
jgi:hypothetical protein